MTCLSAAEANGRMIAAARMLAGLNQGELARDSSVSPSTISNMERGKNEARPRPENLKAIQKSLRKRGITLINDALNGLILVAITYNEPGALYLEEFEEAARIHAVPSQG